MGALKLDNLLALQERDMKRLAFEDQLAAVPRDIASVEAKIAAEKQAIDTAKSEWRELETRKKSLETEIGSAQQRVARYRDQQLQVRKNDEYQALTHEIETTTAQIGTLEEDELRVLYSIDDARKRFAEAEAELKKNISGHEAKIRNLREREVALQGELKAAVDAVQEARTGIEEPTLRVYDRLASKPGHPVCVPVSGGRCGGCHMKVSAGLEFEARKADKITTCDQCSRIIYWQA